ncbi:hypothetical protein GH714_025995 [Hevea brasiliensis]|uniref:DUF4378 domain-containing protein n=1 Tax=Hevea brasiliensis TaxID=3981 RepID=A0A6A6NK62_HEVBR|nr:hypothetical protein GH714_025995 [Hevea brasiliensis]
MTGMVREQNLEKQIEKQMGCMAGFLQIFDRHQILTGKRLYAAKRLPPSTLILVPSEKTVESPAISRESEGQQTRSMPSPGHLKQQHSPVTELRSSVPESQAKLPLPLRVQSFQRSSAISIHRRHQFPVKAVAAAEYKEQCSNNVIREGAVKNQTTNVRTVDPKEYNAVRNTRVGPARAPHKGMVQRKSFYDSADFFPEPKHAVSIYGEIEKRLKMRGIDEPSKDLETLKQILEALQLKGLLHSKKPSHQKNQRNFVYDRSFSHDESPIIVMKPTRSMFPFPTSNGSARIGNDSSPSSFRAKPAVRRDSNISGETFQAMSPRRERPEIERNVRNQNGGRNSSSPTRSESSVKSANRRPLTVETQRRVSNNSIEQRRVSPVQSPKVNSRRFVPDQSTNRSPRNKKPTVEIYQKEEKVFIPAEDESSSISESSISTPSQTDTERSKMEEYKEGRSLLERCDKLLHSIAEMTATELQPSPVSVLDSSFYKEESSPSPVMKRSIDFKEKQQYLEGKDTSAVSRLQRKLTFDTVVEILNRKKQLPPWKAISCANSAGGETSLQQIWSEFQRIRERDASDDLLEVICGLLKKDLAGDSISGWGYCPIEMSETVLYIERQIFKDLIGETIRDLAAFTGKCNQAPLMRRKLVF